MYIYLYVYTSLKSEKMWGVTMYYIIFHLSFLLIINSLPHALLYEVVNLRRGVNKGIY